MAGFVRITLLVTTPTQTRLCERSEAIFLANPQSRDRRAYRLAKTVMKLLHFGGQCEKTYIVSGGKQDGSRKYETTVHP